MIRGGPGTSDPGQITYAGLPFKTLLTLAYGVKGFQISGPGWLDSERYNILAKVPPGTTKEQAQVMLQRLLTERFQLMVRHENREVPLYILTVGKAGANVKSAVAVTTEPIPAGTLTSRANGGFHMVARNKTIEALINVLSSRLDQPVLDQTGLGGKYDFEVKFDVDEPEGNGLAVAPRSSLVDPAALAFALRNQLGLNLELRRTAVDMIVIDSAQKIPVEN